MLRLRLGSSALAAAAAVLATACSQKPAQPAVAGRGPTASEVSPGKPVELATFVGLVDESGKMTIQTFPSGVAGDPGALTAFEPVQDGTPGSGPANSFELVTETGTTGGFGAGSACTGAAWGGNVTLRSFYTSQTFWDVYVEFTDVTPGYEGCNSAASYADLNRFYGLWRYGTIGYVGGPISNANTTQWAFSYSTPGAFTFTGRIMGMPGPLFDWTPSVVTTPVRRFQDVRTTTGHFLWNGTTFADLHGLGITFTADGGTPHDAAIDLTGTPDRYATFAPGDAVYRANLTDSAKIDTSGNFTVCARFKPGRHPALEASNVTKVLVSKGHPEDVSDGWALMQMHSAYCFHYQAGNQHDKMSFYDMAAMGVAPETWAFDYICGGRNTTAVDPQRLGVAVGAHGAVAGNIDQSVTNTIGATSDATLPLVIGAYRDPRDGTYSHRLFDGGVYEVIFDSRPATIDVMNEIVARAEGRTLSNGVGTTGSGANASGWAPTTQTLVGDSSATRQVPGHSGGPYTLAPYMTVPLLVDGNGNLQPSQSVLYSRPFTEDSTTTGYCAGAEVTADAGWWGSGAPLVAGDFLQWGGNGLASGKMLFWDPWGVSLQVPGVTGIFAASFAPWSGWAPGSTHRFMACVDANNATTPSARLYMDDLTTPAATTLINFNGGTGGGTPFDVGNPVVNVGIGTAVPAGSGFSPMTGGRIHRVRFCPSSNPLLCN